MQVATICWLAPGTSLTGLGTSEMAERAGKPTVTEVEPMMVPTAAVTLLVPAAFAVTRPVDVTVKTPVDALDHEAEEVQSPVLPLE